MLQRIFPRTIIIKAQKFCHVNESLMARNYETMCLNVGVTVLLWLPRCHFPTAWELYPKVFKYSGISFSLVDKAYGAAPTRTFSCSPKDQVRVRKSFCCKSRINYQITKDFFSDYYYKSLKSLLCAWKFNGKELWDNMPECWGYSSFMATKMPFSNSMRAVPQGV